MRTLPPSYNSGDTVYCYFDTYKGSDGSSLTISGLAVTDIEIYKDGSTTQRSSDNGYTLLDTDGIDFDGATGFQGFKVDTSDNSDAGFWADGHHYAILVDAITIDGVTVRLSFDLCLGYLLRPATAGRKLVVDSAGLADANTVKLGPTGSGTAQTARDIGASVLLSTGTGTGQLDFTAGVAKANVVQLLGTAWLTPGTAGTPDVNAKLHGGTSQTGRDIGASVLLSVGTGTGQVNLASGKVPVVQLIAGDFAASSLNGKGDWLLSSSYTAPLDAAGVRTAVGLASPNLDTQLGDIATTADDADTVANNLQDFLFGPHGTVASTTGSATTLDTGAAATANIYVGDTLEIYANAGAGQRQIITAYSSGRVATHAAWTTNPNSASLYRIVPGKAYVVSNQDKTGYTLTQAFPSNFSTLLINSSGHISRVTLADTLTTNSDKTGYSLSGTQTFSNTGTWTGNLSGTIGGLTAAGLAMFFTVNSTKLYANAIAGSVVKEIADNASGSGGGGGGTTVNQDLHIEGRELRIS